MNKQDTARATGRTVFLKNVVTAPVKPVKAPGFPVPLRVLKWAGGNTKIGGWMEKGRWSGMPILALTLEERKTCPLSCLRWNSCYGDNMFMAKRHKANRDLYRAISSDIRALDKKYPDGYVVRLHVLGDFFSVEYVRYWSELLKSHPALRIYGYTHWQNDTLIGKSVARLVTENADRVSILRSDSTGVGHDPLPVAMVIPAGSLAPDPATNVICPNETGRVASCGKCGLCMNSRTSVSFLDHSHKVTIQKSLAARGLVQLQKDTTTSAYPNLAA